LTISVLAAYPLAKIEFMGKRNLFFYFLMELMVSGEAAIVPLFITVNGLYMFDTYSGDDPAGDRRFHGAYHHSEFFQDLSPEN
jgi:hypothetical protein